MRNPGIRRPAAYLLRDGLHIKRDAAASLSSINYFYFSFALMAAWAAAILATGTLNGEQDT